MFIARGKAMDKRTMDGNGYVTVVGNPISKEGVFDYLGSQIPGTAPEDANKIFQVYRPAEELASQETIDSFKLMPFIDDHTWLGEEGANPGEMPLSGMTGEQVYWEAPYLKANIRWFSNEMKEALENGKKELSPAYKYDMYAKDGVWNNQPYQYIQRNLRGNHLALVDTGRTGHDIAVMDSAIEDSKMSLEEIIAAIGKMDDVTRAALVAALKASGTEVEVEADPAEPADPIVAVDADPEDPANPATDADVETDPAVDPTKAKDEDPVASKAEDKALIRKLSARVKSLEGKAMDTGTIMKAIGQRNALAERVSVHTGAFACDSMTVEQVAQYGIDKLGLKGVTKGQEISTLNGYLIAMAAAPKSVVAFAQDSATGKSSVGDALDSL